MSHPLIRPRWLLLHLGLTLLVGTMVFLGFWQIERLNQKRDINSTVLERTSLQTLPIHELVSTTSTDLDNLEWRRVTVDGSYQPESSVTIINRSQDGAAGYSPLASFLMTDGNVVFVNRGFVPLSQPMPSMPSGQITLEGYLRFTQTRGTLGAIDTTDPSATEFHRIDLPLISQRLEKPSLPMYVQLIQETPSTIVDWPQPTGLPDLDEGPHFSYAMQWWFFALVAIVGWVVIARRTMSSSKAAGPAPTETSA